MSSNNKEHLNLITTVKRTEILRELEDSVRNGRHIFILYCEDTALFDLLRNNAHCLESTNVELWYINPMSDESYFVKTITETQMKEVLEIYHLYDFSDRITVIVDSKQYGGLFNYVNNGILTKEEMIDALLYKL